MISGFSFDVICGELEHGVSFLRLGQALLGVYSPQGYAALLTLESTTFDCNSPLCFGLVRLNGQRIVEPSVCQFPLGTVPAGFGIGLDLRRELELVEQAVDLVPMTGGGYGRYESQHCHHHD
jgi:hypothetical protein